MPACRRAFFCAASDAARRPIRVKCRQPMGTSMDWKTPPGCAAALFMAGAAQADSDTPFYVGEAAGHVSVDRGSISLSAVNNGGINGTGTAAAVLLGYE